MTLNTIEDALSFYRDPYDQSVLTCQYGQNGSPRALIASNGAVYPIDSGIVDFTANDVLPHADAVARQMYEERAEIYDDNLPLTFYTFDEDEDRVRKEIADLLGVKPHNYVLEIGAGTGRDSIYIASRLNENGRLFVQDISKSMIQHAQDRLSQAAVPCHPGIANAVHLPFPSACFDAVFQFGGVGEFSDIAGFFKEVARVTKPGGRVVVGDESMPPWLRRTSFAQILTNTNPQYAAPLPLEHLPVEARNVRLRWIIGGVFYVLDFDIGVGEPTANIDFRIPGARGGTHRTRYYGQLEGVTPETKDLAQKARAKLGVSMHDWLDQIIREHAEAVLHGEDDSEAE